MGTEQQHPPPTGHAPTAVISERSLVSWGAVIVLVTAAIAMGALWSDVQHLKSEVRELRAVVMSSHSGVTFMIHQAIGRLRADQFTQDGFPRWDAVNRELERMGVDRRVTASEIRRAWDTLTLRERLAIRAEAE